MLLFFQKNTRSRWFFPVVITLVVIGVIVVPLTLRASHAQTTTKTPTPTPLPEGTITEPVLLYGLLELNFQLPRAYDNPYDSNQISLIAAFRPPTGETMVVPGFFMRPYQDNCVSNCVTEALAPAGIPEWRVRFAPNQIGRWRYTVEVDDDTGTRIIRQGTFEVIPSDNPGYVQIGSNPRYFAFNNDDAYFPIGENLAWSWDDGGGIYTYTRWLDELSAAGANYARLNIDIPWFIGLDWPGPAGNYDNAQAAAWRLDTILQMAEEKGIYLQVVLVWHQAYHNYAPLTTLTTPPSDVPRPNLDMDWSDNPYNAANGGPLIIPSAMFTNAEARALLHQRLRYIIARWGYSPHIFAWEIVDEVDGMLGYTAARAKPWLQDVIGYLRENDPYQHLITAGTSKPNTVLWELATLDFAQTQFYQERPLEDGVDQVTGTLNALNQALAHTKGPVLLTAFSLNPWYEPTADDPTGVHVHNTLWTTALSGAAGSAMPWWWDTYIDRENFYSIYDPLALFTRDFPWNSANLEPFPVSLVAQNPLAYGPLRIDDFNRAFPGESPPDTIYRLTTDGITPPSDRLSSYLHGTSTAERSRPQTFIISPPVDTELNIHIRDVSPEAAAILVVTIDGIEAARVDFSPANENILLTLPISAGEHTVVLDNLGADWLQLGYIEIAQYRTPIRALALADRELGIAVAWVHHRGYTWDAVANQTELEPLNFGMRIPEMPEGIYRITFWDTTTGSVIGEESITLLEESDGILRLNLLPITSQLAVSVFRVAGPETEPTPEATPFATRTPQVSLTPTATDTATPTSTPSVTPTSTLTNIPTYTATNTPSLTSTDTPTLTPSDEPTQTVTSIPSLTPSDVPPTQTTTNIPFDTPQSSQISNPSPTASEGP